MEGEVGEIGSAGVEIVFTDLRKIASGLLEEATANILLRNVAENVRQRSGESKLRRRKAFKIVMRIESMNMLIQTHQCPAQSYRLQSKPGLSLTRVNKIPLFLVQYPQSLYPSDLSCPTTPFHFH